MWGHGSAEQTETKLTGFILIRLFEALRRIFEPSYLTSVWIIFEGSNFQEGIYFPDSLKHIGPYI